MYAFFSKHISGYISLPMYGSAWAKKPGRPALDSKFPFVLIIGS